MNGSSYLINQLVDVLANEESSTERIEWAKEQLRMLSKYHQQYFNEQKEYSQIKKEVR